MNDHSTLWRCARSNSILNSAAQGHTLAHPHLRELWHTLKSSRRLVILDPLVQVLLDGVNVMSAHTDDGMFTSRVRHTAHDTRRSASAMVNLKHC